MPRVSEPSNQKPSNQLTCYMNNRSTYILIALALLALVGILYWRYAVQKERFNWQESWDKNSYSETNDQPYGAFILHRLLEQYFPDRRLTDIRKNVGEELPLDSARHSNYIFTGEALYLDSLSTQRLLSFVAAGNTALLSSKTIPFDLMFHLYFEECEDAEWDDYAVENDTIVPVSLTSPRLPGPVLLHYARQNKPLEYRWSYIESWYFCDSLPQRPLGYLADSLINFAEFPYGQGRFLLHTTPIAFSNYHLLRPETRVYAEGVLSYLPEGDIYWDACSRIPEAVGRRRNRGGGAPQSPDEQPLAYILQQPPLAWAWYLLVGLGLLYVLFRAKRRQRIIPVLAKNENSSYEFISTIANLHFRERDYQNLCIQNMKLFLAQLRERYGLTAQLHPESFTPRIEPDFMERLARVSERPLEQVQDIFNQYAATIQFEPTEEMMINLHLAIEKFFKQAK